MSFSVEVTQDLGKLNEELALYMVLSKKTAQQVVDKKGLDLGIKLFRGFWALRTKGGRNAWKGPMFEQAKGRGWKTKVRSQVVEDEPYLSIYQFGYFARRVRRKKGMGTATDGHRSRRGLLVAQELARRQRGAGILGVSFLQRRWRSNASVGRYLAVNKSKKLGTLSSFESGTSPEGDAFFRILNYTPGIDTVGGSRSIFDTAIRQVREDMAVYLVRKNMEALRKALKAT